MYLDVFSGVLSQGSVPGPESEHFLPWESKRRVPDCLQIIYYALEWLIS